MIFCDLLSTESSWWMAKLLLDCHLNSREMLKETFPCVFVGGGGGVMEGGGREERRERER